MATTEKPSEVCPECGGTGWRLVDEDGGKVARRCACAERERRQRLLEAASIPTRYRHCTFDSFDTRWYQEVAGLHHDPTLFKAKRAVQEFVDLYPHIDKGLLLMGHVGTGKTHLAVAALQELIGGKGARGRFADFTSLVLEIQMTFDGQGSSRDILHPLVETELLVLDELGAGKTTQWVMDLLYYLVNTRYLEGRVTIFTTNFSDFPKAPNEESLSDRVSARVRSRLFEMCRRIQFYGADYRRHRLASGDEDRTP